MKKPLVFSALAVVLLAAAVSRSHGQTGACCFENGSCEATTEAECTTGHWIEDGICDPNPCPQPGACCYDDEECVMATEEDCMDIPDWWWWSGFESCDPNPCWDGPVEDTTWGKIKAIYR